MEHDSDLNSYGFRQYRSTHDAITRVRSLLDKEYSPEWILDADVAKCFDRISHNFLLENTRICDKSVLNQWLKCGFVEKGVFKNTDMGTLGSFGPKSGGPQGGIISPMLCNIALNGLENIAIKSAPAAKRGKRNKIHLTRYADDFICTSANKTILEQAVFPAISDFLEKRGLEFKMSKTSIVNIRQGFDFLGFRFERKPWNYKFNKAKKINVKTVLIINPRKTKIKALKLNIQRIINSSKPIESILRDLNPVLRGWSEYFRISYHSLPVFWSLGHYVYNKMWKYARERHPTKNATWIFEKYVVKNGDRKWIFGKSLKESIFDLSKVTHYGLFQIKQGLNPYLKLNKEYYENRRIVRIDAKFRATIYRKFKHICIVCHESLHNGEPIELHHIISQKQLGQYTMNNIQPLHRICHQSITSAYQR